MKNIVNIINFIRAIEPRPGRNIDLKEPMREQIRLLREYGLKGTFLMQYDTLLDDEFVGMAKGCEDVAEIGLWLEIVQPLVEETGEKWNGRYPWDWYNDVGFLIGYEPDVRLKIVDKAMEKFKEIFGRYPESVGSWHIDSVSMKYLAEKYNVSACCICRDQVGIDGYTMQGGFFNQCYYPSVNNMFCPANSAETQINMPVFRMLGSCPIYEIDCQLYPEIWKLGQPTLEPVSENFGGNEKWCDWFFEETFGGAGISFQYTQAGQENSFGWPRMNKGLTYQSGLIKKYANEGKAEVMTLGEAGKWYKENFELTAPASQCALSDFWGNNKKSVWYNSRFYRANLLFEDGIVKLRDMYVFNDAYKEIYLENRCETHACQFRNLPVMDSVLYTNKAADKCIAGVYFTENGKNIIWDDMSYSEKDNCSVVTLSGKPGTLTVTFSEKGVDLDSDIKGLMLKPVYNKDYAYGINTDRDSAFGNHNNKSVVISCISGAKVQNNRLELEFEGMSYGIEAKTGAFNGDFSLCSDDGKISVGILTNI